MSNGVEKILVFVTGARKDLMAMPDEVQDTIGYALDLAQRDMVHHSVKALKGFPGTSVMEIVVPFRTDAYRGIYAAKFEGVIYVLHCFQKKSTQGIAMSQQDKDLIRSRLKLAQAHYEQHRQQVKPETKVKR